MPAANPTKPTPRLVEAAATNRRRLREAYVGRQLPRETAVDTATAFGLLVDLGYEPTRSRLKYHALRD